MASETWDIGDALGNLSFTDLANLLSQYHQIANTSPGTNLYFDPDNPQSSVATPQDYTGDIPAGLLPHYQTLLRSGLPPAVAKSILIGPSTGEGEGSAWQQGYGSGWPYSYAGHEQEFHASQQPPSYQDLWNQMTQKMLYDRLNLPTQEGNKSGDDDNLGFTLLPSGQYLPTQPYGSKMPDWWPSQTGTGGQ